jgi:hypothetical protein
LRFMLERKETDEEFQARMDRARKKSAAETNREVVFVICFYAAGFAGYYYLRHGDWHGVYFLFAGVNLLLLAVATSLLIGIYKSRLL